MEKLILWALATLVSSFIGSYLGAYLKKKGENLATQEDIGDLVEQVRAVTTTTKEIEAKISGDVWNRQRRWELKRDVLFEATRRLSNADNALVAYSSTLRTDLTLREGVWNKTFLESSKISSDARLAFDEVRLLAAIVCSKETREAFDAYSLFAGEIIVRIGARDAEFYDKSHVELVKKFLALRNAIRKELEIDKPA